MTPASEIRAACNVFAKDETWETLMLMSMDNANDGMIHDDTIEALEKFVADLKSSLNLLSLVSSGDLFFAGVENGEVTFSLSEKGQQRVKSMKAEAPNA